MFSVIICSIDSKRFAEVTAMDTDGFAAS